MDNENERDNGGDRIEKGHQPSREPDDHAVGGYQPETSQDDDGPPSGGGSGKK